MSSLTIEHPTKFLKGEISLPSSKSISNRMLVLQQILQPTLVIQNLSTADDTVLLQKYLPQTQGTVDVKNAGTCMRFLTAYYAATPNTNIILHGNERMHLRPIKPLVDALLQLGADIDYIDKPGFAPLRIKGKQLNGGLVQVDGTQSSQFVSALMLIAANMPNKLVIHQTGAVTSEPYIHLTQHLLRMLGVRVFITHDLITVEPIKRKKKLPIYEIEADWSSASYWYAMTALAAHSYIFIANSNLHSDSAQGDSAIEIWGEIWGVHTDYIKNGVMLKQRLKPNIKSDEWKMNNFPDLVPALVTLCCGLNKEHIFSNVASLQVKESNRLDVLCSELSKCGFNISHDNENLYIKPIDMTSLSDTATFNTHGDHRMAMSFAAMALVFKQITIKDAHVVEKSYPHFWSDMEKMGFIITKS